MRTLETKEKVVSKCLSTSWLWKDSLPKLNIINAQLGLSKVFPNGLSRISNNSFLDNSTKSGSDNFAWYSQYDKLKKLWVACTRGSSIVGLWTKKLGAHIAAQRAQT
jgi:hypothetical protein